MRQALDHALARALKGAHNYGRLIDAKREGDAVTDTYLFVSYVSEDTQKALQIADELRRRGVECWIAPRNLPPGSAYDSEIARAIAGSSGVLLVFSERCNQSVYIRREVTFAGERDKRVIPLRIEPGAAARDALALRLIDLHWVEWFGQGERAFERIVSTIHEPWPGRERRKPIAAINQDWAYRAIAGVLLFGPLAALLIVALDGGTPGGTVDILACGFIFLFSPLIGINRFKQWMTNAVDLIGCLAGVLLCGMAGARWLVLVATIFLTYEGGIYPPHLAIFLFFSGFAVAHLIGAVQAYNRRSRL